MTRITNCAICSKALITGWDTYTGDNYPYNVLDTYVIDDHADACEGIRTGTHRNDQCVIICNECMLCIRKLINMKKEEIKVFRSFFIKDEDNKNGV